MKGISGLIDLAIFSVVILIFSYLDKKSWFGLFLNKKIKSYYNSLVYRLSSINGMKMRDEIIQSALKHLKSLYSLYKKPPINDLYNLSKDVFDNYKDYSIVDTWVIFYVYTYIKNQQNDAINIQYFEKMVNEKLDNCSNIIPETFFYHFNIRKEQV